MRSPGNSVQSREAVLTVSATVCVKSLVFPSCTRSSLTKPCSERPASTCFSVTSVVTQDPIAPKVSSDFALR